MAAAPVPGGCGQAQSSLLERRRTLKILSVAPWGEAKFIALLRESQLAAETVAFGATLLGRANYAHQGYYAQAFFALSVGFERCGKLALVLDHALENGGTFPSKNTLKDYGHDLKKLLAKTDETVKRRGFSAELPATRIHHGIVSTLSDFATNTTRYYNLEFIAGEPSAVGRESPTAAWYQRVSQPVAAEHYRAERRERDEAKAYAMEAALAVVSTNVQHYSEEGDLIDSVYEASCRTAERYAVVPWERMYVLQFGRCFGLALSELVRDAHSAGLPVPQLSEVFGLFNNDDKYFRARKMWSIYDK
jgi:hypothetical protein